MRDCANSHVFFLLISAFKNKKVVLVAVPGAFTPTCQANHLPGFIQNIEALKAKGIEQVVVIASNDPFVMSAWGKANYTKDDYIVSLYSPLLLFLVLLLNSLPLLLPLIHGILLSFASCCFFSLLPPRLVLFFFFSSEIN